MSDMRNARVLEAEESSGKPLGEFEERLLVYAELVYTVALRLTRNDDDAKSLAQRTLERAWCARKDLERQPNLKPWLLETLRNLFIRENLAASLTLDSGRGVPGR